MLCFWASADFEGFTEIFDSTKYHSGSTSGNAGVAIRNLLMQVFKNLAIVVFIIAIIVAFISVIRLLTSDNGEEDFSKWLNTLIWSVVGLFLISISYTIIRQFETRVFVGNGFSPQTIYNATINIIYPLLNFMRYIAATVFFATSVYAFFRIITAGGDEEGFEQGKKIFIGSVLGFVLMLLAEPAVRLAYGGGNCGGDKVFGISTSCTNRVFDTGGAFGLIAKIIVFLNGFLALVVLIMIMYAGFLILTGGGDEEKSETAKKTITYAIIGIIILIFSYVIYRFMILQS